jgi:hypothetical protein
MDESAYAPGAGQPDLGRIGLSIGNAVIHATTTRSTAFSGQTVGEFLQALQLLGVREDDALASIEFGVRRYGNRHVCAERNEFGAVEIREVC